MGQHVLLRQAGTVGNIETYSGYTTTTAATTFTRPVTITDFVPSPVQTATLQPKASGTVSDCYVYENAFDATSKLKNLSVANSCSSWAHFANVTIEQLLEWNPSLSANNCVLQAGKATAYRSGRLLVGSFAVGFTLSYALRDH